MLRLLSKVPTPVWLAAVGALLIMTAAAHVQNYRQAGVIAHLRADKATQAAAFEAARALAAEQYADLQNEYRQREQELRDAVEQSRKERDVQVHAARRDATVLRERLRIYTETPVRTASYALSAATVAVEPFAPGSVGALVRDQAAAAAGLLIDEAERADVIRAALMQCYAQYDAAVEAVNGAQ